MPRVIVIYGGLFWEIMLFSDPNLHRPYRATVTPRTINSPPTRIRNR